MKIYSKRNHHYPRHTWNALAKELLRFGMSFSPKTLRTYVYKRGAPSGCNARQWFRWLANNRAKFVERKPCAHCLYRIGMRTHVISNRLGARVDPWIAGVQPPSRDDYRRRRAREYAREWRLKNPDKYQTSKRKVLAYQKAKRAEWRLLNPRVKKVKLGTACAECLFRIGLGVKRISQRVPIGRTCLRVLRPAGIAPAPANPKKYQSDAERWRENKRRDRGRLGIGYVKKLLIQNSASLRCADIPHELVEVKRAELILKREIQKII